MLELIGAGAGLASFVFLGAAIWHFLFWSGRRSRAWAPLGLWFVCAAAAGVLLSDQPPQAKAARDAEAAGADKADVAREAEAVGAKSLADYMDMSRSARTESVQALMAARGLPSTDTDLFAACLGEYAPTKNPELTLSNVFGWCESERTNAPQNFAAHFNELDAPDYSTKASVICRNIVEGRLRAPSSADFPWIDDQVIALGRHEYDITSHVDSQNGFGAMLRSRYSCRVKFKGGDSDPLMPGSWDVVSFSIE